MKGKKMNREKKSLISLFIVVILIAAAVSIVVPTTFEQFQSISYEQPPLQVLPSVDRNEGVAPLTVNFTPIVWYNEGKVKYLWSF